jgi:hypothetical protein
MRRVALSMVLPLLLASAGAEAKDFTVTPDFFSCIANWTKIRNTRIFHPRKKMLRKAIRVFESGKPHRRYPVGTILQLIPFEAMVKHKKRYFPETDGWEFFALGVSKAGTVINSHGGDAINFVNLSCKTCHSAASKFDWVCEKGHGCNPIPVTDELIARLQENDPRCQ